MTVNFDHVRVDQSPGGEDPPPQDTTPPTTPGKPAGTEPLAGHDLDHLGGLDRRVAADHLLDLPRRRPAPRSATTTNTSYSDTGLAAGSFHTYAVRGHRRVHQPEPDEPGLGPDPGDVRDAARSSPTSSPAATSRTGPRSRGSRSTAAPAARRPPRARAQVTAQSGLRDQDCSRGTFTRCA